MVKRGIASSQPVQRVSAAIVALPALSQRVFGGIRLSMPKALRPAVALPESLGRIGALEVRLAVSPREVKKAQKLRYKVFYEEMSAIPDMQAQLSRRDRDGFDKICDHLLVIDHDTRTAAGEAAIVGTYRLLRQEVASRHTGFYTASEFDIAPLLERHNALNFLELGRSCVLKPYRTKRTVELLWHGIWSYVRSHGIDVMVGCASLEGTNPDALELPLSFLHHNARAPAEWSVSALPHRRVPMDRLPEGAIDMKAALKTLPPLIKGYLRLGAYIGDGAVIDRQFGTTDVLIVLPVSAINERYVNHYGVDATRYAA
ncbi:GNAT family N-acetyltransferase [Kaistia terrae]|jgi:putative hemolysin|uniref:L-ornithine N(alpha)-acyltransferase n=1 Tax=Kaistia terrae TaxID=537017 RepID=A0ABW0PZ52_9HYPH